MEELLVALPLFFLFIERIKILYLYNDVGLCFFMVNLIGFLFLFYITIFLLLKKSNFLRGKMILLLI
ncbi:hypothetical protein AYJ10_16625 [Serratia marcescens]|nr:hypothetical protein AYJ10_16625 [Serratia marcescens]